MLAQNFLSHDTLGINQVERGALITVLGMLERGEIEHAPEVSWSYHSFDGGMQYHDIPAPRSFNMAVWCGVNECGTVACIRGWAAAVARPHAVFAHGYPRHDALAELFEPHKVRQFVTTSLYKRITPSQAATALRSYLTTGEPNWAEALAVQS